MKKSPASIEDSANASAQQTRADSANAPATFFHSKLPANKPAQGKRTMTKNEQRQRDHQTEALRTLGFDFDEIAALRRINSTLRAWNEREANGEIERDEQTGKPMRVWETPTGAKYPAPGPYFKRHSYAIPDRETGALKRWRKIMAAHPTLWDYYQTDCRGCAVWIGNQHGRKTGVDLESCYTNGIAVW
jgi:hypothetical protein